MKKSLGKEQTPQDFAKEHWKEILAVSGTLAGAVIYLLIRYHKKRKAQESGQNDSEARSYLDTLADDALQSQREPVPLMLDLMPEVAQEIPDAEQIAAELAKGLPTKVIGAKSRSRWFRGNPKEVMSSVGKIK